MNQSEQQLLGTIASWGGWLSDKDAICLGWCLEDVISLDGKIIEIGSYMGKSSSILSYIAKNNNQKLICIDPFEWDNGTYIQFQKNLKSIELYDNVIPITTTAKNVMEFWNSPIKFLFIDADHDYASCKEQFEFYKKFLLKGSIVCFDDTEILDKDTIEKITPITDNDMTNKRIWQIFPEYQQKYYHAWIGPSKVFYECLESEEFELIKDINGDKINAVRKL